MKCREITSVEKIRKQPKTPSDFVLIYSYKHLTKHLSKTCCLHVTWVNYSELNNLLWTLAKNGCRNYLLAILPMFERIVLVTAALAFFRFELAENFITHSRNNTSSMKSSELKRKRFIQLFFYLLNFHYCVPFELKCYKKFSEVYYLDFTSFPPKLKARNRGTRHWGSKILVYQLELLSVLLLTDFHRLWNQYITKLNEKLITNDMKGLIKLSPALHSVDPF